jgi:hypothetical protein
MDKPITEDRTKPNPDYAPAKYKVQYVKVEARTVGGCLVSGWFTKDILRYWRKTKRQARKRRYLLLEGKVIPIIYRRSGGTWTQTPKN